MAEISEKRSLLTNFDIAYQPDMKVDDAEYAKIKKSLEDAPKTVNEYAPKIDYAYEAKMLVALGEKEMMRAMRAMHPAGKKSLTCKTYGEKKNPCEKLQEIYQRGLTMIEVGNKLSAELKTENK